MRKQEKASLSIMKIICVSVILILLSGIGTLAVNAGTTKMIDVRIILQNGYEMSVMTSKEKVSDILEEKNIILKENQKVIPALDELVKDGTVIKITDKSYNEVKISEVSKQGVEASIDELMKNYSPITEKIVVEQVEVPFETITKNVAGNSNDTQNKVIKNGQNGLKEVTYKVKYQNNVEIEKIVLAEKVIREPVNKIVQVNKKVTSRGSSVDRTNTQVTSYNGGRWSYSASEFDLLCAITAQECGSSYNGALAVITTACNRAESAKWARNGRDPLNQYKAKGQFCYSIDNHWRKRLNGNYPSHVAQAVKDALNGKRNHGYLSFRSAGKHSGTYIGGNVYF